MKENKTNQKGKVTPKISASEIIFTFKQLNTFFAYPATFWDYVAKRVTLVDSKTVEDNSFYSVLMKLDDNDKLIDMKIIIPYMINIETILINVHELKHAYDLYLLLGKQISDEEKLEKVAKEEEDKFIKKYYKTRSNAYVNQVSN